MLFYHLAVTAFLLVMTANMALNWGVFTAPRRRLRREPAAGSKPLPLVSVLVPARNEAGRLPACLASLLRQDYPNFEVIVLDDHSEDGTATMALGHGLQRNPAARQRLIDGQPLPAGWTGKAWACHQLSQAATGEYLLFTDADTVHESDALRACLEHAQATGAALLSMWPRQVTRTWSEHAVIPLMYVLLLGALPLRMLHRLQRFERYARWTSPKLMATMGAANGQYMLFRRDAYDLIGGHAAVRDHLVEDVALGRLVAGRTADGLRLVNADGSRLVRCRMYESFGQVWEGFTKNLRAVFSESAVAFWTFGLTGTCALLMPFVFVCLPRLSGSWWWLPVLHVAWIGVLRVLLTARFRASWWGVPLHPVGEGLSLLIGLNSWRLSTQKGVTWKGRTYRMSEPSTVPPPAPAAMSGVPVLVVGKGEKLPLDGAS